MRHAALFVGAAALALPAATASADVQMKFLGTGSGSTIRIESDGYDGAVFAGQLRHRINAAGDESYLDGDWTTFCTDVHQFVTSRYERYEVGNLEDAPNAHPMGAAAAQAVRDVYAFAGTQALSHDADDFLAAAFQIAIWEIVEDYDESLGLASLDVTSGSFRAYDDSRRRRGLDSSIADHLADLFGAIGSGASEPGLVALISECAQDQLVRTYIPAPGTLAGFAGLGALAARRRRRG